MIAQNNSTKNIKDLIDYSNNGIISKILFKGSKINSTLFCMSQGTDMSEHTSTKEGFIYVIEGEGVFNLEGNDLDMQPSISILMKKDAKHSIIAKTDLAFLLLLA